MTLNVTATISVSKTEKLDCNELAEFLGKCGILTSVTPNISIVPTTSEYKNLGIKTKKEYGCRLVQNIDSKDEIKDIWDKLKKKYGFNCAHLTLGNTFDGCILNYLAPSKCNQPDL